MADLKQEADEALATAEKAVRAVWDVDVALRTALITLLDAIVAVNKRVDDLEETT